MPLIEWLYHCLFPITLKSLYDNLRKKFKNKINLRQNREKGREFQLVLIINLIHCVHKQNSNSFYALFGILLTCLMCILILYRFFIRQRRKITGNCLFVFSNCVEIKELLVVSRLQHFQWRQLFFLTFDDSSVFMLLNLTVTKCNMLAKCFFWIILKFWGILNLKRYRNG